MPVDNSFVAAAASFLPPAARLWLVPTGAPRRTLPMTTQSEPVVVPPSIPRLLGTFVVSGGGMVGGLLVILGPGPLWGTAASVCVGLIIVACVVGVIRQRPRVEITSEGFTVYKLFGQESRSWGDVAGEFAVIQIGSTNAVGYNLVEGRTARAGARSAPRLSGYDAGISGAFAMPAEGLANVLNAHARQAAGGVNGPEPEGNRGS